MISRSEALNLLNSYIKDKRLLKHCLAVEAIMRRLAEKLNEEIELWGLTGLLHDIDYEVVSGDMSKHGLEVVNIVKNKLPSSALEAIKSHNERLGVISNSKISKALRAADHLSGLIIATALVMPNKKLSEVTVKSLMKKFKQKDFASGINRLRIQTCIEIGLTLEEFLEIGLEALQKIHLDLEL
ncbi:MAG: HD domain-containing protein [Candidatus Methanomethylicia archaeon]